MAAMKRDEQLLQAIKKNLPELKKLKEQVDDEWGEADSVYRFYHGSFKVYGLQGHTRSIVDLLKSLMPDRPINTQFLEIYNAGTGKKFDYSVNAAWSQHTRPIVEAFYHAKYFLEMAIRSGETMESADDLLPSHWAGFLYFFNLR